MKYTSSVYIGTEDSVDFSILEATLLPKGFKVEYKSVNSMVLTRSVMQSIKKASIRGVTRISVKLEAGLLKLDTNLTGVLSLSLFVCLFPPLLLLFILSPSMSYVTIVWSWLLIGPAMSFWLRHRTVKALNTFLENTAYPTQEATNNTH
ncbi:hypothetical protein [Paraglaciecola sp. L3A3]|uniref:hypothetical protein n=1 Tax=Paraglaciecola sp. L3A3 TaxID=2686358 RepID=UPI00131CAC20|nr:hypothetical protein [Paraglaciecola sp. L3A3]